MISIFDRISFYCMARRGVVLALGLLCYLYTTQHTHTRTLSPEQLKEEITVTADKKTSYLTWVGLGLMSVQFGVLARLTWWEYSWDIMVS